MLYHRQLKQFLMLSGIVTVFANSARAETIRGVEIFRGGFTSAFSCPPVVSLMYGYFAGSYNRKIFRARAQRFANEVCSLSTAMDGTRYAQQLEHPRRLLNEVKEYGYLRYLGDEGTDRFKQVRRLGRQFSPLVERFPTLLDLLIDNIGTVPQESFSSGGVATYLSRAQRSLAAAFPTSAAATTKNVELHVLKSWRDSPPVCFITPIRHARFDSRQKVRQLVINEAAVKAAKTNAKYAFRAQASRSEQTVDFVESWGNEVMLMRMFLMADHQMDWRDLDELNVNIPRVRQVTPTPKTTVLEASSIPLSTTAMLDSVVAARRRR